MARFLKWFGLIFTLHIIFIVAYVWLHPEGDIPTDEVVFYYFVWPLFFIPTGGGSHGGELLFSPVTIFFYSLFFAAIVTKLQNRPLRSK